MEEAWLSGKIAGVPPILMPAAHALAQAAHDIRKNTANLSDKQIWMKPHDAPSAAFHLLHIAGSIERLLTYARGEELSELQFAKLAAENIEDTGKNAEILVQTAIEKIELAIETIKTTPVEYLFEERTVGRKKLQTNVFGLLFHIAEHTQRHCGQLISTAAFIKNLADE